MAKIGYGTTLGIEDSGNPGTFISIGGLTEFTEPEATVEEVDATHLGSQNATTESIPGLITYAAATLTVIDDPQDAGQQALVAALRQVANFQATLSTGEVIEFSGYVSQVGRPAITNSGLVTRTFSIKPIAGVERT